MDVTGVGARSTTVAGAVDVGRGGKGEEGLDEMAGAATALDRLWARACFASGDPAETLTSFRFLLF